MSQGDAGDEEDVDRTHHCANAKTGASSSNGSIIEEGRKSIGIKRGG
jgi:hypothetical protein